MYAIKNQVFLDLAKTQKSALCNFLRAHTKKLPEADTDELFAKFYDDEKYYLEQNSSRFPFLADFIEDEKFMKECKLFLKECKKYYDYKKSQEPFVQAQKEYEKKKRKFLQEKKMDTELPTKKQVYYHERLCKRYNIDKIELTSKLHARDEIDRIVNEYSRDCKNTD